MYNLFYNISRFKKYHIRKFIQIVGKETNYILHYYDFLQKMFLGVSYYLALFVIVHCVLYKRHNVIRNFKLFYLRDTLLETGIFLRKNEFSCLNATCVEKQFFYKWFNLVLDRFKEKIEANVKNNLSLFNHLRSN